MTFLRLLPLLTLIACGSGDSPPASDSAGEAVSISHADAVSGTFEVTISGDVQDRFSGLASFFIGTDEDTGERGIMIVMNENPDSDDGRTVVIGASGGRPEVGVYPFINVIDLAEDEDVDDLPPGLYSFQAYGPGAYMLHPLGGTVRITESTSTSIIGTFALPARSMTLPGHLSTPAGTVQVEGHFSARVAD